MLLRVPEGPRVRAVTIPVPYQPLPIDQSSVFYAYGPDSIVQDGVPAGEAVEFIWEDSTIYPGTVRKFWVHLPAGYEPSSPAPLMIFNDGWWYLDPAGDVRGGIVLDNLIHRGDIPPVIGLFVDPGSFPGTAHPKNRNAEYDADDDRYVQFLLTEIIAFVTDRYAIVDDSRLWGICGGSSGGVAAFTAAWHRPDKLRRVVAFSSSFVQMPQGNIYPDLIADQPRKPLRIFLAVEHRDDCWNQREFNFLSSNLRVAAALAEADYDFRLVLGDGPHHPNHGGVLLPDALRWTWRPEPLAEPTDD